MRKNTPSVESRFFEYEPTWLRVSIALLGYVVLAILACTFAIRHQHTELPIGNFVIGSTVVATVLWTVAALSVFYVLVLLPGFVAKLIWNPGVWISGTRLTVSTRGSGAIVEEVDLTQLIAIQMKDNDGYRSIDLVSVGGQKIEILERRLGLHAFEDLYEALDSHAQHNADKTLENGDRS